MICKHYSHSVFTLLLACLLFTQCATVSTPTGGPKDELPPVILGSSIESGSTNFTGNTITLTFNEWIKMDNPALNVYSSPPLGNKVNFQARKNKLFVIFKEALEDNTTYHLNFGNSIQDVHEGNPLKNYQFVFATGDVIDSLSYQGRLQVINDVKLDESTLIGLYKVDSTSEALGDSIFMKQPPFYFTFVGDNGNFLLDYLKAGSYRVYALTDRNNNYYYDLPNEAIGFLDSTLALDDNVLLADIPLFLPEESEGRVKSFTNSIKDYKIEYEISKSVPAEDQLTVEVISDSIQIDAFHKISDDRKKVIVWLGKELQNISSLRTVLLWDDVVVDTFEHSVAPLKFPKLEIEFHDLEMTKNDSLIISLSNPMYGPCENIARIDTLNGDTTLLNTYKLSDFQLVTKFETAPPANVVYTLLTSDSCVIDIYDQVAVVSGKNLKIVDEEERGTLILIFEEIDSSVNYLVELQNEKSEKIRSMKISDQLNEVVIKNLLPGKYSIQVIEDENKNGVWNSGTLIPRVLPEKIYKHPKEFTLRPNWELEESIKLSAP